MSCAECRQQLELSFGRKQLDPAVAEHLARCAECRAHWAELGGLADDFRGDDAFRLGPDTVEQMARRVDRRIDLIESVAVAHQAQPVDLWSWLSWARAVPAAAAVLLVVGVGIAGYWLGRWEVEPVAVSAPVETTADAYGDEAFEEPDELTVQLLLDNFTSERRLNAGESLLDDITEEELRYLESNFDIGVIL